MIVDMFIPLVAKVPASMVDNEEANSINRGFSKASINNVYY